MGNYEPKKNLAGLLKALALVDDAPPLAIVGGGRAWAMHSPEDLLRQATPAVRASVRHIGYVPRRDLPAVYAGAAAFVFPSLAEGFGLPVAEALAAGAPVVASDQVPLRDLGRVALLSPAGDALLLAANLNRILRDDELALRLRREGREFASAYTWEKSAAATLENYLIAAGRQMVAVAT